MVLSFDSHDNKYQEDKADKSVCQAFFLAILGRN